MKPWNFHAYGDIDWKKQYDPVNFYKWRRTAADVRHLLSPSKISLVNIIERCHF